MSTDDAGAVPVTMRAWQYSRFGGGADALQLNGSAAVPAPKAGEVLVRVQAASVNPVDWKLQAGIARPMFPASLPFIPAMDLAGEVVQVGPGGAGTLVPGDQVFGVVSFGANGGFAEYAILAAKEAATRPPEVTPAQAASLGIAGQTALQGLRDCGAIPISSGSEVAGDRKPGNVLVANASGGVGHYAVQLAKLAGEHVTATCGTRNADWVKSLGADEVLDYKTPEGAALKSPSGCKYDVILDGTVGQTWKTVGPVLSPQGKWVHITPNMAFFGNAILHAMTFSHQKLYPMFTKTCTSDLAILASLTAEGKLKTFIDAEFPFDKVPDAWRKSIEGHVKGKVVVLVP